MHEDVKQSKVYADAQAAMADIQNGASIMSGGFGLCGIPENCIAELYRRGLVDLTIISNHCGNMCGTEERGLMTLLERHQIKRFIGSFIGGNKHIEQQILDKEITAELIPQGTFSERMRAGGAGIPAFFTPTGAGTTVAEGKVTREFNGRTCLMETALTADFAIIKAYKGDSEGNLIFHEAARNFSPLMAMAAKCTIAEVEELVEPGQLDPSEIHTPGVFVQRIFQGTNYRNDVEKIVTRPDGTAPEGNDTCPPDEEGSEGWSRKQMAWRAARELQPNTYVNLGVGLPTMCADYLPASLNIRIHSENGLLGVGPYPTKAEVSRSLVNAGKETVTLLPGASCFDSAMSFAMIRGGHIDYTVLGALEVAENGDLANWIIPGKKVNGMGGAMDLAAGARKVIVLMTHQSKNGAAKIKKQCSMPLTAERVVDTIVTNLAVIDVTAEGLVLRETAPGISVEEVIAKTEAPLIVKC